MDGVFPSFSIFECSGTLNRKFMHTFLILAMLSSSEHQGGAIRSYLLMKGFVVRTMLLSVCFLLCKLEVNNQCNQSPIESRNWNFLAFYEKVCWYNLNSIEKTVLRSNGLCRTWYYSQFGLYDNSTGVCRTTHIGTLLIWKNPKIYNRDFTVIRDSRVSK